MKMVLTRVPGFIFTTFHALVDSFYKDALADTRGEEPARLEINREEIAFAPIPKQTNLYPSVALPYAYST
jgi:hypothetical protein